MRKLLVLGKKSCLGRAQQSLEWAENSTTQDNFQRLSTSSSELHPLRPVTRQRARDATSRPTAVPFCRILAGPFKQCSGVRSFLHFILSDVYQALCICLSCGPPAASCREGRAPPRSGHQVATGSGPLTAGDATSSERPATIS
jgi:hypothetical protein